MTRDAVVAMLVDSLIELQIRSGLAAPADLCSDTRPLDLEEFDSIKCLELEVLLSEKLGFEVEHVIIPEEQPSRMRTMGDIADAILACAPDREASNA